jgi:hypothetical protein
MQDAMGYREISRAEYDALLAEHARADMGLVKWTAEAELATVAQWVSTRQPRARNAPSSTGSACPAAA